MAGFKWLWLHPVFGFFAWLRCILARREDNYGKGLIHSFLILNREHWLAKMQHNLENFRGLINSGRSANVPIFLLLNKIDIFIDLISVVPIKRTFPNFCGGSDYYDACEYFADLFRQIDHRINGKLYIHYTNAVDTESFAATIQDMGLELRESWHPELTPVSEFRAERRRKKRLMEQIRRIRTSPWETTSSSSFSRHLTLTTKSEPMPSPPFFISICPRFTTCPLLHALFLAYSNAGWWL